MRSLFIIIFTLIILGVSCNTYKIKNMENPFLQAYTNEFEIPPFDKIKNEHFKPAFDKAFEEQNKEIDDIINQSENPTFENTIVELEYSGDLLKKVSAVFFNYLHAITSPELQKLAEEITPEYTKHADNINLNEKLFLKIKSVYDK